MMRMYKRSRGACALACLTLPALSFAGSGCAREGGSGNGESRDTARQELVTPGDVLVPWGAAGLGFDPGGNESHARGPESIAFQNGGGYYVLDSVASRVVRVDGAIVHAFAVDLPKDADGIAVSPQGELAVHRALDLHVLVYDTRGRQSGQVPVPAGARDANIVHLLSQGRVMLEHPYQERYLLGSPNVPRQPETILPSRRQGVGDGFAPVGYQIILKRADAESLVDPALARLGAGPAPAGSRAILVRRTPVGEAEQGSFRYDSREVADLGEASSGRIVGVRGDSACSVLERVDMAASVVDVKREVVCTSLQSGKEMGRFAIETSTLYTPRQDVIFNGKQVAYAVPTKEGLRIRSVALGEVSK